MQALGSVNQYDRPWRGGGQGQPDYDFLDEVQASDNDQPLPIAIEVFEGPLLTVTVSASQTTVPVGGTVTFSATVTGQNGSALSYSWNFDGGAQSSTAANPQVTFGNAGQYDVTVEVTDTAGGGGGAEIPITVGTPPLPRRARHKQTGSGTIEEVPLPERTAEEQGNHAGGPAGNSNTGKSTTTGKGSSTAQEHVDYELDDADVDHPRVDHASAATGTTTHHPASTSHRAATPRRSAGRAAAPPARPTSPPPSSGPLVVRAAGQRRDAAVGGRQPARPRRARRGRDGAARSPGDPRVAAAGVRRGFRGPPAPRSRSRAASCAGGAAGGRCAPAAEILVLITVLPVIFALSTNGIDQAIFHVANALEVPVLILALVALALVIFELGSYLVELSAAGAGGSRRSRSAPSRPATHCSRVTVRRRKRPCAGSRGAPR